MSGLLFLSSDDFHVIQEPKGRVMCHSIPGFSLVLFYSTQCGHCKSLIPIFKRLPGTIVSGCQFGIINVSSNKKCVAMSKGTLSEVKYVPYIVLYVDGRPQMKYAGPHDINEIARFVLEVSKRIQSRQSFANNASVHKDPRGGIPAYSEGKPLCGPDDKICYLTNTTAYSSKDASGGQQDPMRGRQKLPSGSGM
jgi:thiol-disulfide isomerase/thioredoxin